jgi:hypothetical protein
MFPFQLVPRFSRGRWWFVIGPVALLVLLLGGGWWGLWQAARHEPAFYRRALAIEIPRQRAAGDALEREILELHNEVRKTGQWQAVFTDEQINGWLASDLPDKFPRLLPAGVREPRIALEPDVARVACRYESSQLVTIVSLSLDIHLTDEPNVLAIRLRQARAGAIPLPLKHFLDRISAVAAESHISLQWAQEEGDPVALLTIPSDHGDYVAQGIAIDSLELRQGQVVLAGRSGAHGPDHVAAESANSAVQR